MVTQDHQRRLIHAYYVSQSAVLPNSEPPVLVPRPFRLSAFMLTNAPISFGMLMSPPTMAWTTFWQVVNISLMAGINYHNKNAESKFTNSDLAKGYFMALASGLTVGVGLRSLTKPLLQGASGSRLLALNCLVSATASGTSGFFNCVAIRKAEVDQGITVYQDKELKHLLGKSQKSAEKAVVQTA